MSNLLYLFAQWWLSVLPVDDVGRRCCDETLADWRKEAAKATSSWASLVVSVRAIVAVIRCLAGVSLREVVLIRQSGVLTRVFLWIGGYLVTVNAIIQLTPGIWKFSALSRFYGQVALVAYVLPVALLLGAGLGARRQRVPVLGLSLAAFLTSVVLLGWAMPFATSARREAINGTVVKSDSGETHVIQNSAGDGLEAATGGWTTTRLYFPTNMFANDLTVRQLTAKIVEGPQAGGWKAIRWMSFFFAYAATCALIPMFASRLRGWNGWLRFVVMTLTLVLLFTQGSLSSLNRPFSEFSYSWWLGAFWIPVAWMALCLIAGARRDTVFK